MKEILLIGNTFNFDLADMYSVHMQRKQPITMLLTSSPTAEYHHKLFLDGQNKVIEAQYGAFTSADTNGYNATGTYIINPECFPLLFKSRLSGIFLREAVVHGYLYGYPTNMPSLNVNTEKDLYQARGFLYRGSLSAGR